VDVWEKAEEQAGKWNAGLKKCLGEALSVLTFAGAGRESRHGRKGATEGRKAPGQDTPIMAQDQGNA